MKDFFRIEDLHVEVEGKEIIKGLNLSVEEGEISAIMGPNGSGKSTLSFAVMGHPKYKVTGGKIIFRGKNIISLKPHERARLGLFLAFQNPFEIEGVPVGRFLWRAVSILRESEPDTYPSSPGEFNEKLKKYLEFLQLDESFRNRDLNFRFSGGEKKRAEIVQLLTLKPKLSLLDEIDSGLDVDSVRLVASAITSSRNEGMSFLLITHYQRILQYIKPSSVHILVDGKIVESGGPELAEKVERTGYEKFRS